MLADLSFESRSISRQIAISTNLTALKTRTRPVIAPSRSVRVAERVTKRCLSAIYLASEPNIYGYRGTHQRARSPSAATRRTLSTVPTKVHISRPRYWSRVLLLLGSVASAKYTTALLEVVNRRLLFLADSSDAPT